MDIGEHGPVDRAVTVVGEHAVKVIGRIISAGRMEPYCHQSISQTVLDIHQLIRTIKKRTHIRKIDANVQVFQVVVCHIDRLLELGKIDHLLTVVFGSNVLV